VRHPQHADLINVWVIPNQDLQLIPRDLETMDFKNTLKVQNKPIS
jgi:hypothetical protein